MPSKTSPTSLSSQSLWKKKPYCNLNCLDQVVALTIIFPGDLDGWSDLCPGVSTAADSWAASWEAEKEPAAENVGVFQARDCAEVGWLLDTKFGYEVSIFPRSHLLTYCLLLIPQLMSALCVLTVCWIQPCFPNPLWKPHDPLLQDPSLDDRDAFLMAVQEYNSYGSALNNAKWQIDESTANQMYGFKARLRWTTNQIDQIA